MTALSSHRIGIVAPFFNEEASALDFLNAVAKVARSLVNEGFDFVLICVNDGSTDRTEEILKHYHNDLFDMRIVSLARNFGHQIALSAGIDHANDCDAIILMDSDLQHPPELIRELLALWKSGVKIVQTIRKETSDASYFKKFTSRLFYSIFNKLSDIKITENAADFCLLDKQVAGTLRQMREQHRFLRGLVSWIGFNKAYLPYVAPARGGGKSKYSVYKMLRLASDALFSFSGRPAKLATWFGLFFMLLGISYAIYLFIGTVGGCSVVGDSASLLCITLLLNGTTLLILGIQGQYIARIFEEVKKRPLYTVREVRVKLRTEDDGTL